jgi:hypothetical protein
VVLFFHRQDVDPKFLCKGVTTNVRFGRTSLSVMGSSKMEYAPPASRASSSSRFLFLLRSTHPFSFAVA